MSEVRYDTQSRAGQPGDYRQRNFGAAHAIDGLADGRLIYVRRTDGLEARWLLFHRRGRRGTWLQSRDEIFHRPDTNEAIRFVAGGDMGISRHARKMVRISTGRYPLIAAIAGDLAYANGRLSRDRKRHRWFDNWRDSVVSPDGFMVPMILAIGNHEVQGGYCQRPEKAPYYFGYFRQGASEGRAYFSKRVGKRIARYLLDSGHIAQYGGMQAAWLESGKLGDREVYCRVCEPKGSWYDRDASAICVFEMSDRIVFTYRGGWCAEGLSTSGESAWRVVGARSSATLERHDDIRAAAVKKGGALCRR